MHITTDFQAIEASIQGRFARLADDPASERTFPVGPESAKRLGYDAAEVDDLPPAVKESFAGVGNPLRLGELRNGQRVLDLGCGAGFDSILAARRVAPSGKVTGVDFTPAMIEKARANAELLAVANAEFHIGRADDLPVPSASMDVLITNGVLNLCVEKRRVVEELFRVLKPSGSLRLADILLEPHVTPQEVASKGKWSD